MRRRDILIMLILIGVVVYAWGKLRTPKVKNDDRPLNEAVISSLSMWNRDWVAEASSSSSAGLVKGETTEPFPVKPDTLLPVEEYYGAPFLYTLAEMLAANGVTVYPEDVVETFPSPSLGIGSAIKIYRATSVEVTDWGKKKTYRTWAVTVQEFMDQAGLELGDNDRIEPALSSPLTLGEDQQVHLTITRVAITEVKVKEKIDFKKIRKEDPELPRGQKKVDKGVSGERTKTFRVTRENGVEVKRELLKNEVTKQPKDEVVIIGTKVLIGKTYTGKASWYKYNSTKVATDLFKRGTELRITNLDNGKVIFVKNGGCICADTGYVVDLHPDHFTALGGVIRDGVMKRVKVDEVLN